MLLRSQSERRPMPGLTALLSQRTLKQEETSEPPRPSIAPRESIFTPLSLSSPPPWVAQALINLEQGEQELLNLRERQQNEVEEVNRQLDNAVIDAQREERRLLEKIQHDHRDAQRHLEQVKRENAAAVRVVQSIVDQQIRKIIQVKDQIQRWGCMAAGANKTELQSGVAEVTTPWEISLTLKRVNFVSTSWAKALSLGDVEIQEQAMIYPIGVCGVQGQKCALHSGEEIFNLKPLEIRRDPQLTKPEEPKKPNDCPNDGNVRVIRKLRLSGSTENENDLKSPTSPVPRRRRVSESSQDEQLGSMCLETQGQDLFLPISQAYSQGDSEGEEYGGGQNGKRPTMKNKKKQNTLVPVSRDEPSCPPEETNIKSTAGAVSPKMKRKNSLSRHSLGDLTRRLSLPQQTLLRKKTSTQSVNSSGPPSPTESEDSCYTYNASTPVNGSLKQGHQRTTSTADLSGRLRPLITSDKRDSGGTRKVNKMQLASMYTSKSSINSDTSASSERPLRTKFGFTRGSGINSVSRSQSMSAIEGEKVQKAKETKKNTEKPPLKELEEEVISTALETAVLIKHLGKLGSGRNDFNFPSGVHATVNGQLYITDCGNARIQVTDIQKNLVQQVSPTRAFRVSNFFDVAVNSSGLVALTCAAERALLVFSRHGRLLQKFGGTMVGTSNEELDAPRGVTVTRYDEFLVADLKRGSLTALKLDPKTGVRLERTVVTGYHKPYQVAACHSTGLMAVSERGTEGGRVACIRVLNPEWTTIRILGVCSGMGPVLSTPWGLCIDNDGDVIVTDWGKKNHRVIIYPSKGVGWPLITENLSNPRGLALLPDGQMALADSMNHCVKIFRYKTSTNPTTSQEDQ